MASRSVTSLLHPVLRSTRTAVSILRPYPRLPRTLQPLNVARRLKHSIPRPPPRPAPPPRDASATDDAAASEPSTQQQGKTRKQLEPHYQLTFTCVPCGGRSTHEVSKQAYHHGSSLITCPSCRNRHIISDHLGIFADRRITVEDLMRERGRLVKRGTLGEDGDVEFWEDGTTTAATTTMDGSISPGDAATTAAAASEAEEASRLREARNPSARSAGATPTPASSLGVGSTRPSADATPDRHAVPSTRREYSTDADSKADADADVTKIRLPEGEALPQDVPPGNFMRFRKVVSPTIEAHEEKWADLEYGKIASAGRYLHGPPQPIPWDPTASTRADAEAVAAEPDSTAESKEESVRKVLVQVKVKGRYRMVEMDAFQGEARKIKTPDVFKVRRVYVPERNLVHQYNPRPSMESGSKTEAEAPPEESGGPSEIREPEASPEWVRPRGTHEPPAPQHNGQPAKPPSDASSDKAKVVRRLGWQAPPRASVPPWERRALFGAGGRNAAAGPSPPAAPAKSNTRTTTKEDVWGDAELTAEMREYIEKGFDNKQQ